MLTRIAIAALIYSMVDAVLFGIGLIAVLTVPALSARADTLVPAVVVTSLILAIPVSWIIAPRLRARYWRQRAASAPCVARREAQSHRLRRPIGPEIVRAFD
jgi:hypothetical protein